MNNNEIINLRKEYYSNPIILNEIIKIIHDREIAILDFNDDSRYFKRGDNHKSVSSLRNYLKNFLVIERPSRNIYMSVAKYSSFPKMYTINGGRLNNDVFWNHIRGTIINYDILLDLDLDLVANAMTLRVELTTILLFLNTYKVKFCFTCSGSGFHIFILDSGISLVMQDNSSILYECMDFVKLFKVYLQLNSVCLVNSGVWNRIVKIPFSLTNGNQIVLPNYHTKHFFTNTEQFEDIKKTGLQICNPDSGRKEFLRMCEVLK